MANFARLNENNFVIDVKVVQDSEEHRGEEFLAVELGLGGRWIKTSYNSFMNVHYDQETKEPTGKPAFRKNYAGIGYTYDEQRDAFIPPQPFDSWTLNEDTCLWESPIPYPEDGKPYTWNEENGVWEEIS